MLNFQTRGYVGGASLQPGGMRANARNWGMQGQQYNIQAPYISGAVYQVNFEGKIGDVYLQKKGGG